jgi:hypothetical protein
MLTRIGKFRCGFFLSSIFRLAGNQRVLWFSFRGKLFRYKTVRVKKSVSP